MKTLICKYKLLTVLLQLCPLIGMTQEWDPSFWLEVPIQKHIVLSDGARVILGTTEIKREGDYDMSLTMVDERGDIAWRRQLGGDGYELPSGILQTADGNFLILASTTSIGAGDYDIWLLKIDREGALLWQHTFGGQYRELGENFQILDDGNIVLKGIKQTCRRPNDPESCFDQVWIVKCDANGNELWNKTTVMIRSKGD